MTCPPHHYRVATPAPGLRELPAECIRCGHERTFPTEAEKWQFKVAKRGER